MVLKFFETHNLIFFNFLKFFSEKIKLIFLKKGI